MTASANPSPNTNGSTSNGNGTTTINNGGCTAVPQNSAMAPSERGLKHKVDISVDWTRDEQSLLEELLAEYASDSKVLCFAKIAGKLNDKTVRDVALRCRSMTKKENGKRRKDDNNSSRKHKHKKEKVAEQQAKPTSHATKRANGPVSMNSDEGISYEAIGGVTGELLEQNAQALDQISANFSASKVHENISLFCQTRNNILTILNELNDMPEEMRLMPPVPVKLNEELANSILPQPKMSMQP